MTSTELKIGLTSSARPSSRVLKPPGGGHSNIFAEPEVAVNAPRPKYNQQNSSNLNACMGSTDANIIVEKLREEITQTKQHQPQQQETTAESPKTEEAPPQQSAVKSHEKESANNITNGGSGAGDGGDQSSRGRVPPGGFSSGGFW